MPKGGQFADIDADRDPSTPNSEQMNQPMAVLATQESMQVPMGGTASSVARFSKTGVPSHWRVGSVAP